MNVFLNIKMIQGYLGRLTAETIKLIRLGRVKPAPVKAKLLASLGLVEKRRIYQADASRMVSARHIGAENHRCEDQTGYW